MNELAFACIMALSVFMFWEVLCYTQLKITKRRNRDLHKRIYGEQ